MAYTCVSMYVEGKRAVLNVSPVLHLFYHSSTSVVSGQLHLFYYSFVSISRYTAAYVLLQFHICSSSTIYNSFWDNPGWPWAQCNPWWPRIRCNHSALASQVLEDSSDQLQHLLNLEFQTLRLISYFNFFKSSCRYKWYGRSLCCFCCLMDEETALACW